MDNGQGVGVKCKSSAGDKGVRLQQLVRGKTIPLHSLQRPGLQRCPNDGREQAHNSITIPWDFK